MKRGARPFVVVLLASAAGCQGSDSGTALPDAPLATADASSGEVEQVSGVMPPIVTPLPSDGLCVYPDGSRASFASFRIVDDCTICQCTTYGMRCARRAGCPRDVCVLVDGTTLAAGAKTSIYCNECSCESGGSVTCARTTAGECPDDACVLAPRPDETVPLGGERFVSECHRCSCDADTGLTCSNICHPECSIDPEGTLTIADQARLLGDDGCSTCVCDYSDLMCEQSGCD